MNPRIGENGQLLGIQREYTCTNCKTVFKEYRDSFTCKTTLEVNCECGENSTEKKKPKKKSKNNGKTK